MSSTVAQPYFLWPLAGSLISVQFLGIYRHVGIVSDRWCNGKPMVISNSDRAGGVREEPWNVFAAGRAVTVEASQHDTSGHVIIARARSRIGTRYNLLTWNCEHLVQFAQGINSSSPQVVATLVVAALWWALAAKT